jgi:hypothetical protein
MKNQLLPGLDTYALRTLARVTSSALFASMKVESLISHTFVYLLIVQKPRIEKFLGFNRFSL